MNHRFIAAFFLVFSVPSIQNHGMGNQKMATLTSKNTCLRCKESIKYNFGSVYQCVDKHFVCPDCRDHMIDPTICPVLTCKKSFKKIHN